MNNIFDKVTKNKKYLATKPHIPIRDFTQWPTFHSGPYFNELRNLKKKVEIETLIFYPKNWETLISYQTLINLSWWELEMSILLYAAVNFCMFVLLLELPDCLFLCFWTCVFIKSEIKRVFSNNNFITVTWKSEKFTISISYLFLNPLSAYPTK